jgi:hypothetical protein
MNRRHFLKASSGLTLAALCPWLTGCSLKGDAQNVLDILTAIYNADPTASWAPDLKIAIGDMQVAIADWNGTSVNCELQSAVTIAAAILDSIPLGAAIDLIVTVALAGINALLSDLLPCTTAQLAPLRAKLSHNYSGKFHSTTPAYIQDYAQFKGAASWHVGADVKKAFNQAAKDSGLPQAEIK